MLLFLFGRLGRCFGFCNRLGHKTTNRAAKSPWHFGRGIHDTLSKPVPRVLIRVRTATVFDSHGFLSV